MESSDHPDRVEDDPEAEVVRTARDWFSRSPYFEVGRITSTYHRGALMLRGCVSSRYLKQVAQELASRVPGVRAVINEIVVRVAADRGPSGADAPGTDPDTGAAPSDRGRGDPTRRG